PRGTSERVRDPGRTALLATDRRRSGAARRRVPGPPATPIDGEVTGGETMLSSRAASKLIRGIALGLVAIAGWGLTACGGTSQSKGSGRYRLTLIVGVRGDEFYTTMACGAQEEARKLGVSLTVQGPAQFDPSLQTPIVNAVGAAKPDAVMIAPTDATA